MKKILGILFLVLILNTSAFAAKYGKGELKLSDFVVKNFMKYIRGSTTSKAPFLFAVSMDGLGYQYYYCPAGLNNCSGGDQQILQECERSSNGVECKIFARNRTIKWKNGINPGKGKASKIHSKWDDGKVIAKLTELGFLGGSTTSATTNTPKITKKVVKKYELKGERSIALSWEDYEDLIAGTVKFDETDYRGTLNLPLPNNDGICDGTYSLQKGGKGTWQIACSNNMGAAGTLKWTKDGGVTGTGRDHKDKKVKFTVSKNNSE